MPTEEFVTWDEILQQWIAASDPNDPTTKIV